MDNIHTRKRRVQYQRFPSSICDSAHAELNNHLADKKRAKQIKEVFFHEPKFCVFAFFTVATFLKLLIKTVVFWPCSFAHLNSAQSVEFAPKNHQQCGHGWRNWSIIRRKNANCTTFFNILVIKQVQIEKKAETFRKK